MADSFDAMTTSRPYKDGLTLNEAIQELRSNGGRQFDEEIVEIFTDLVLKERI